MTTRVSSKRQITIPAELCRQLDIEPGQPLEVSAVGEAIVLSKPRDDGEFIFDRIKLPPLLKGDAVDYVRRIRDGGDLDELDGAG